ncbi:MAG: hypothetical protein HC921_15155 [Synechococcaceae cyanobacterium SM2_3_1]|nr:hypothetical protein [Synechococcaceae cyanobacterium SM2_3_1]
MVTVELGREIQQLEERFEGDISRLEERMDGFGKRLDPQEFISRGAILTLIAGTATGLIEYLFFPN